MWYNIAYVWKFCPSSDPLVMAKALGTKLNKIKYYLWTFSEVWDPSPYFEHKKLKTLKLGLKSISELTDYFSWWGFCSPMLTSLSCEEVKYTNLLSSDISVKTLDMAAPPPFGHCLKFFSFLLCCPCLVRGALNHRIRMVFVKQSLDLSRSANYVYLEFV